MISNNACVTQKYRLSANCDFFAAYGEGTDSQVSLNVKRNGLTVVGGWIPAMDKTDDCPDHTYELAGEEPDELIVKNHGNDELGVSSFTLYDETNGGEIRRWSPSNGGEGWCLSSKSHGLDECWYWDEVIGAHYPNLGVILKKDGSHERIRFSGGTRCSLNGACSSLDCKAGGGDCDWPVKCCKPVSSVLF